MSMNVLLRQFKTCLRTPMLGSKVHYSSSAQAEILQIEPSGVTNTTVDPLKHPDYFKVHNMFNVKDLYNARVHYGHKEGTLNDYMRPYIFGSRLGYLVFDLDQTADLLRQALNFTAHIAYRGGIILFLTRNHQTAFIVDNTAKECGEFSNTRIYRHGIFTNSSSQFQAVTRLPDLCIYLSTIDQRMTPHKGIQDCAKMLIPTVAIVDTNSDPRLVTYPVPGNDDSPQSVQLFCNLFKEAVLRGKAEREKILEKDE